MQPLPPAPLLRLICKCYTHLPTITCCIDSGCGAPHKPWRMGDCRLGLPFLLLLFLLVVDVITVCVLVLRLLWLPPEHGADLQRLSAITATSASSYLQVYCLSDGCTNARGRCKCSCECGAQLSPSLSLCHSVAVCARVKYSIPCRARTISRHACAATSVPQGDCP